MNVSDALAVYTAAMRGWAVGVCILALVMMSSCGSFTGGDKPVERQSGKLTSETSAPQPPPVAPVAAEPPPAPVSQSQPKPEAPTTPPRLYTPTPTQSPSVAVLRPPAATPQQKVVTQPNVVSQPAPAASVPTAIPPAPAEVPAPRAIPPPANETHAVAAVRPPPQIPPQREPVTLPNPPPSPVQQPPVPRAPGYQGPASGVVNWSGQIEKNGTVIIGPGGASAGTISGQLPGVPVLVEVDTREFAIAEAPGPSNQWSRITIRSKNRRQTVISIKWSILK